MTKKNFSSRRWLDVTRRCERASASSGSASTDGRVRLGAIVFLSALGLALFGVAMRAALMAAPVDVAPTWGNVLIAGGNDSSGYSISSTELYDPATNSFAAGADTAVMNSPRQYATATLLASGKVLIAGGFNWNGTNVSCLSSTELYDPATNSFAAVGATAAMNTARCGSTATLLPSGKLLIAGGIASFGSASVLSSTELYDPATNSFAAAADTAAMNTARVWATATLLASGKVLIAGGANSSSYLSSTELYDPTTNSFAAAADTAAMNTAHDEATATLLASGKVLIAGGFNDSGELASTELYDPATNSFAPADATAAMNSARLDATATLLASGNVLIAGGFNCINHSCASLSSTELYDPATNSFAAPGDTAVMNTARDGATGTLLASGKVLIAGGIGPSASLPSTELYDPATNSFAAAADTAAMNTARYGALAMLLPPSGRVTLLPSTLDFGMVKVGQSSHASMVTLSNGTGKKLTINRTAIGGDFKILLSTCSSTLKAGQSCNYWLIFHPQSAGTKNELFRLFDNAPHSPQKVKLHGVGTRR